MNNWKETTLGEAAETFIDYRGKTPPKTDTGIPLITAKIVKNGTIETPNEFISPLIYSDWMRRGYPEINDVLVTTEAPLGEVALLKNQKVALAQRIILIRGIKNYCDNVFLKYYLQSPYGQKELKGRATGTTVEGIKASELRKILVPIPPISEQKAIAAVLSSLDNKIELLQRQNKTLEKIAQTIFKEWFVNFKVKGQKLKIDNSTGLPEGWKWAALGDYLSVSIGGDWGSEIKMDSDDVQAYCLRGTDIDSLKAGGYSAEVPLRWIRKKRLKKRMIAENDFLIGGSGLGPIGKTLYCHSNIGLLYDYPITYSNFCKRLTAKNKHHALYFEYLISRLYTQGALERFFTGTSIPNLDTNGLLSETVAIPLEEQIEDFSRILDFKYSKLINPQIQTLSKLRDTLLPKLMKGEIRLEGFYG